MPCWSPALRCRMSTSFCTGNHCATYEMKNGSVLGVTKTSQRLWRLNIEAAAANYAMHESCSAMFAAQVLKAAHHRAPKVVAAGMVSATCWKCGRSRAVGTFSQAAYASNPTLGAFPDLPVTNRVGWTLFGARLCSTRSVEGRRSCFVYRI